MTSQDNETIKKHYAEKALPATIILSKGNGEIGDQLLQFCENLQQLAPHITVKKNSDIAFEEPVIVVGRHQNIAYYALPTGKILPLFLEALDRMADEGAVLPEALNKLINEVDLPVGLKLYVASQCPHCPHVLRKIQTVASETAMIRLQVINVDLFPDHAQNDSIRSVPTLILDEQIRWTGQVSEAEVLAICANRDPSQLSADSLRQIVEDGNAAQVSAMMTERDQVFPALVELLIHPRWSVRLGAMVTAEYLADDAPGLGGHLCSMLWERFPDLSTQVQGDVVHLFGLVTNEDTQSYLQSIVAGSYNDEVKDAAAEVLAELDE